MSQLQDRFLAFLRFKKERRVIAKAFKDELANHGDYQLVLKDMAALREKKKSIEYRVMSNNVTDAGRLDVLKLEMDGAESDIATLVSKAIEEGDGDALTVNDEHGVDFVIMPKFKVVKKN